MDLHTCVGAFARGKSDFPTRLSPGRENSSAEILRPRVCVECCYATRICTSGVFISAMINFACFEAAINEYIYAELMSLGFEGYVCEAEMLVFLFDIRSNYLYNVWNLGML